MELIEALTLPSPAIDEREILRYAGCKENEENVVKLLYEALDEALPLLSYKVCFGELPLAFEEGGKCILGHMDLTSRSLARHLKGCSRVILFAATVGVGLDRAIAKYSRISPAKAVMLQSIGAERIEALCDDFCEMIKEKKGEIRPRFSPGYGDLPLGVQREIFDLLSPERRIGVCLNDSLLMSPSKSVTAFIGIPK